jgi:hypothetical protein
MIHDPYCCPFCTEERVYYHTGRKMVHRGNKCSCNENPAILDQQEEVDLFFALCKEIAKNKKIKIKYQRFLGDFEANYLKYYRTGEMLAGHLDRVDFPHDEIKISYNNNKNANRNLNKNIKEYISEETFNLILMNAVSNKDSTVYKTILHSTALDIIKMFCDTLFYNVERILFKRNDVKFDENIIFAKEKINYTGDRFSIKIKKVDR